MASIPSLLFDDTDFTYTGQWDIGGRAQVEYRSTTHGTNQAGASASFVFTGTSISVYGTIAANAKSAVSTYTVDGSHLGTFIAPRTKDVLFQQLFYHVSGLPYGRHNLIITCTTEKTEYWLDFVAVDPMDPSPKTSTTSINLVPTTKVVTASPSKTSTTIVAISTSSSSSHLTEVRSIPAVTSLADVTTTDTPSPVSTPLSTLTSVPISPKPTHASTIIIDDNDSGIIYRGAWFSSPNEAEYDSSSHGSQDEEATATLHFTGTGIAVYGTVTARPAGVTASGSSTYAIDGRHMMFSSSSFSSTGSETSYRNLFFQSDALNDGKHTIVITVGDGSVPFYLDYFEINSTSSTPVINMTPSSSLVSVVSPSPSPSSGNYTPPDSSNQVTSPPSASRAGSIAGGLIGALVFIALAIVVFLWYRQRRTMRAPSRQAPKTPDPKWFRGHAFRWSQEKVQPPLNTSLA